MLEIIHVHDTGDVPKALTVNGIFSRDVYADMHTGVRKAVAVMDCTMVSINRIFCESFSPYCTKVFHVWPQKKNRIALNILGMKELLPSQIHHWGEKQESDFTVFSSKIYFNMWYFLHFHL